VAHSLSDRLSTEVSRRIHIYILQGDREGGRGKLKERVEKGAGAVKTCESKRREGGRESVTRLCLPPASIFWATGRREGEQGAVVVVVGFVLF
jgi:hypothetical protein